MAVLPINSCIMGSSSGVHVHVQVHAYYVHIHVCIIQCTVAGTSCGHLESGCCLCISAFLRRYFTIASYIPAMGVCSTQRRIIYYIMKLVSNNDNAVNVYISLSMLPEGIVCFFKN